MDLRLRAPVVNQRKPRDQMDDRRSFTSPRKAAAKNLPVRLVCDSGGLYLLVRLVSFSSAALFCRVPPLPFKKLHWASPRGARRGKLGKITKKGEQLRNPSSFGVSRRGVTESGWQFGAPTGLLAAWKSEEEMGERCAAEERASLHCAHWVDEESGQQAHK